MRANVALLWIAVGSVLTILAYQIGALIGPG